MKNLLNGFTVFARWTANASGNALTFIIALLAVIIWAALGPTFGYSDTWQLVINTATTIITFLMVFIIQHTQNRDTQAIQLKLDELIRATKGAHNMMLDLEHVDDNQLKRLQEIYEKLASKAREGIKQT
jgi:low affinity Fe/Cu permease